MDSEKNRKHKESFYRRNTEFSHAPEMPVFMRKRFPESLLHEFQAKGCLCIGGTASIEPDDLGSENENEREKWLEFMQRCVKKSEGAQSRKLAILNTR